MYNSIAALTLTKTLRTTVLVANVKRIGVNVANGAHSA